MVSQTAWSNSTHPNSGAINNFYGPFGNGYVPLFAVVAADYKVVYCDNDVGPLTSKINDGLGTFDLVISNGFNDFELVGDEMTFDLSDHFNSQSGLPINYSATSSNTDVLNVSISGTTLTLSRASVTADGVSEVSVTATAGDQVRTATFDVGVFVPAPVAGFGNCIDVQNEGYLEGSIDGELNTIEVFSFEGWIKITEGNLNQAVISKSSGDTSGWYLDIMPNGGLKFYVKAGTGNRKVFSVGTINVGEWNHIACMYDGLKLTLMINGVVDNTKEYTTYTAVTNVTSVPLLLGKDGQYGFVGMLDDFSIWNRALTEAEAAGLMNRVIMTNEDGLIASWSFDVKFGNEATDLNSNYNLSLKSLSNSSWITSTVSPKFTVSNGVHTAQLPYNQIESGYQFMVETQPTNGSVSIEASTGIFTYNATPETSGEDTFTYKIYDGSMFYSNIVTVTLDVLPFVGVNENLVSESKIIGNYPNPFNPETTISYSINELANVSIAVYNSNGEFVTMYNVGEKASGTHNFVLNAGFLTSGIYWYSLSVNGVNVDTSKMILIK
ncbi:MAG: T9SS type A sorting domain-containing protein [Candidatus Delongbacteria bacterium]|nr:T9SS type A sorting domain-containing protein [Candidatus Delongbacteria bacterium]MBN2835009.1 T9SS type A sorting domain-containing protein [Candidatus Delongbacteria bacterium]